MNTFYNLEISRKGIVVSLWASHALSKSLGVGDNSDPSWPFM